MKLGIRNSLAAGIFAVLAISLPVAAQETSSPNQRHRQYKLYDMGTFGGPGSYGSGDAVGISSAGAIGASDTSVPDPFSPNCIEPECFVLHAFLWRNRFVTDLGALPGNHGGNSSYAFAINNLGLVVGISENGALDPATGFPEVNAVVWSNRHIINLGTFGGTQSKAEMLNDRGQVVGLATNTISDPFSFGGVFPAATQAHAFLWERGVKHDLGTLGGPDSIAHFVSQTGKIAGWSYTNNTPNSDSGVPTIDPFLWDDGRMIDLGGLGGDLGYSQWINNQGDVVGYSFLEGDQAYHGFLWSRGVLRDLGTLGGSFSAAFWINDAGDAVGGTTFAGDQITHATLFSRGRITDLGTVGQDQCSLASANNSSGQVVGNSGNGAGCFFGPPDARAFLWENGGPMVDLNALVENPSNLTLWNPLYISDNGEIIGNAFLPNGDMHAVVLVPDGDCDRDCEKRVLESQEKSPALRPAFSGAAPLGLHKAPDWHGLAGRQSSTLGLPFGRFNP